MLPTDDPADPRSFATVRFATVRSAARRTFGSLDTRNYRLYFGGELVSYIGSWMQTMAEAWLVLSLTGSGAAVGATFACRFLPVLLFGLWGGAVADHFDRRKVLLVTQSIMALLAVVLWLIVWTDVVNVWMVFGLAIALGTGNRRRRAGASRVRRRDGRARQARERGRAQQRGDELGAHYRSRDRGHVIATVGSSWVFFVNAISFVAVVIALARDAARRAAPPTEHHESRPACERGSRTRGACTEIRVDDPARRRRRHARLQLPDVPHADGVARRSAAARDWPGFLMAILGIGTVIGGLFAAHRGNSSRAYRDRRRRAARHRVWRSPRCFPRSCSSRSRSSRSARWRCSSARAPTRTCSFLRRRTCAGA